MKKIVLLFTGVIISLGAIATNKTLTPSQGNSTWNSILSSGLTAGDTVFMEDGVYTNFQVQFKGNGTVNNPIILRARNYGKVKIEGQINFKMSGSYLVVDGLHFRNGWAKNTDVNSGSDLFEFRTASTVFANNSRLTNCVFDSLNNPNKSVSNSSQTERWVMLYGKNNRIDHCYFANKFVGGVIIMNDIREVGSQEGNNLIDHNFFGNRPKYSPGNGAEIIRPGDSERSQLSAKCTISENIFYHCDGEIEAVSLKSCDNVVQNNIMYESAGMFVCRHGHRNTLSGNVFIGNDKSSCGGIRVINSGHKIYNNFFQGLKGTETRSALCVMTGFDTSYPLNSYYQVADVEISFNTFVNCVSIEMATKSSYESATGNKNPIRTKFWNNIIYNKSLTKAYIDKSNTSGIDFKGNYYNIKAGNTFVKTGFESTDIEFVTNAKGIFYLKNYDKNYCVSNLYAEEGLNYVDKDISGKQRIGKQNAGSVNFNNIREQYKVPKVTECGVAWYVYAKPNL
ncbi:lyase [Bacteroidia bacterium]|nr:lyase [Bacteroidia bacterium]